MKLGAVLGRHVVAVGVAHLGFALASLLAGVGLLRLLRWSRLLTVLLCWLSVAYALAVGAHLLGLWWLVVGEVMQQEGPLLAQLGGSVLLVLLTLALVVPLVLMVRYLRRADG